MKREECKFCKDFIELNEKKICQECINIVIEVIDLYENKTKEA